MRTHQGVWLPKEKELHYFDEKLGSSGLELRARLRGDRAPGRALAPPGAPPAALVPQRHEPLDMRWDARYFLRTPTDAWYASLFRGGEGRITGEITPRYAVLDEGTVAHVASLMPAARIVFLMRNPIERAWSHAVMQLVRGREGASADDELRAHFAGDESRSRTDYVATIDRWARHFPPEQVFLGWVEDVHFRPRELMEALYAFLGAGEPERWTELGERVFGGARQTMPAEHAAVLAEQYAPLTAELDARYGGHAAWWRFCCEQLAAGVAGDAEIPYPLYATPLREAYLARAGAEDPAPLQSGPLAPVTA